MKALILTSHIEYAGSIDLSWLENDFLVCADGGARYAEELGLTPDLYIGDYDSGKVPASANVILLPAEKDQTDTEAALELAWDRGCRDITILGGLGGRFDHTMGNIALMKKYCDKVSSICILDGTNLVMMKTPGNYTLSRDRWKYLSVMAYGDPCEGVCLTGVKYPIHEMTLTSDCTLTVSNEITSDAAHLSFRKGHLLVIRSSDS